MKLLDCKKRRKRGYSGKRKLNLQSNSKKNCICCDLKRMAQIILKSKRETKTESKIFNKYVQNVVYWMSLGIL